MLAFLASAEHKALVVGSRRLWVARSRSLDQALRGSKIAPHPLQPPGTYALVKVLRSMA